MHGALLILLLSTEPLISGEPAAPPAKRDACSLISDADVHQITKVPMKRQPDPHAFNCSYVASKPVPGPITTVSLHVGEHGLMEDVFWKSAKKSAPGKPSPLAGVGDDAFYVRSSKTDAAIYVRKGYSQFILTGGGARPGLFDAMKALAKKIAAKL
jgi:hypothetical protein